MRALTDRFSIGSTVKYIKEKIWNSSASAVAFDIGLVFTTTFDALRLGASMSNFGPKMQMKGRDIIFSEDPNPNQTGNVEVVNSEFLTDKFSLPAFPNRPCVGRNRNPRSSDRLAHGCSPPER